MRKGVAIGFLGLRIAVAPRFATTLAPALSFVPVLRIAVAPRFATTWGKSGSLRKRLRIAVAPRFATTFLARCTA